MGYEFLEHTADVKFSAWGDTIEKMFGSAVDALNETIRGDIKILEQEERSFSVSGTDYVSLLYNFLEEFLFLLDAQDFLVANVRSIEIETNNRELKIENRGLASGDGLATGRNKTRTFTEDADPHGLEKKGDKYKLRCIVVGDAAVNYKFTNDVKAVTYSEMSVGEEGEGKILATDEHGRARKGEGEKRFVCEVVLDV